MKKAFILFLLCVGMFVIGFLGVSSWLNMKKYDFSAQSINGEITLSALRDKYKIVYFGYMSCPDICPTTLSLLSRALQEVDSSDIVLVFVSLDSERDNLENLNEYIKYFYKDSYGVSLQEQDLQRVVANYGVKYQKIPLKNSAIDYSVAHSSSLYLLDKDTKLHKEITNLIYEEIVDSIKSLVQSKRES